MIRVATKTELKSLERGVEVFGEILERTEAQLPDEYKHITDRLGITLGELKGVVECLNQKGVMDAELADVEDGEIRDCLGMY